MPQAIDLILKNGASTPVDKTFTLLSPAAGYNSVAEWALKEGPISSVFPRITTMARPGMNSARTASKHVQIKLKVPSSYTDTVTGLTMVGSGFEMNASVVIPNDFPEALKDDAAAFAKNLLAHALIQAMVKDGSPAT